jgi:hypothetical protein
MPTDEDSLVQKAALALAAMATGTIELDADLLATHRHQNVRQVSAHLCVRQPERYGATAQVEVPPSAGCR